MQSEFIIRPFCQFEYYVRISLKFLMSTYFIRNLNNLPVIKHGSDWNYKNNTIIGTIKWTKNIFWHIIILKINLLLKFASFNQQGNGCAIVFSCKDCNALTFYSSDKSWDSWKYKILMPISQGKKNKN